MRWLELALTVTQIGTTPPVQAHQELPSRQEMRRVIRLADIATSLQLSLLINPVRRWHLVANFGALDAAASAVNACRAWVFAHSALYSEAPGWDYADVDDEEF